MRWTFAGTLRLVGVVGMLSLLGSEPVLGDEGRALGGVFGLDTRARAPAAAFGLGGAFELSTLQIAGRVLRAGDQEPLEAAVVEVAGATAVTAADGAFALVGVRPGLRYAVTASASGHGSGRVEDVEVEQGRAVRDLVLSLDAVEEKYSVSSLLMPSGVPSSLMQGGTVVRYFQVRDGTGQPAAGVQVEGRPGDVSCRSDAAGIAAVRVPWAQLGDAAVGSRVRVQVAEVGGRSLGVRPTFMVEIAPRTQALEWRSSGYAQKAMGGAQGRGGICIRLEENDGDGDFDWMQIGIVGEGATAAGDVVLGPLREVGNASGSGSGPGPVSEDRYGFAYPERTSARARAQYALVAGGLAGELHPQLVNLLGFAQGRLVGGGVLDKARTYSGRGLQVPSGSAAQARANAGVLAYETDARLAAGADLGAQGRGLLLWSASPASGAVSLRLGASGPVRAAGRGGLILEDAASVLGAAAFAGLEPRGQVGGSIEVFFHNERLSRIELETVKRGVWGYDIGTEFLLGGGIDDATWKGRLVEALTRITITGPETYLQNALVSNPLGRSLARRQVEALEVGGATLQRLVNSLSEALVRFHNDAGLTITYVKEMGRVRPAESVAIDLPGQADFYSPLASATPGTAPFERQKRLVVERGAWIAGALRPLELYADDAFVATAEGVLSALLQEMIDGMGESATRAFSKVDLHVQDDAETIVGIGRAVLQVPAGAVAADVGHIGARAWSWWGPAPQASPASLSAAEFAQRRRIADLARRAAHLNYGIGGFYRFLPAGEVLETPARLHLVYGADEVAELDEADLAIYAYDEETGIWLLVGGKVNVQGNVVEADIAELGLFTLAPRVPDGTFELVADRPRLPADAASVALISSGPIRNNDGRLVAEGTLFDVRATGGAILAEDEDAARDGLQLAAAEGRLSFPFRSGGVALPVDIVVRNTAGRAQGRITLELTDAVPPAAPTGLSAVWRAGVAVLRWDASAAADVAGYRIYYNEGRSEPPYTGVAAPPGQASPVDLGAHGVARLRGLDPEQVYYFAASAYDIAGNESALSASVAAEVDATNAGMAGDFDGNGHIDFADYFLFVERFGAVPGDVGFEARYDLDGDGRVDFGDLFILGEHFDQIALGKLLALTRQQAQLPAAPELAQNYPNPFNTTTLIRYAVPQTEEVALSIRDILGRPVRQLARGQMHPGRYTARWNGVDERGRPVASGVYIYILQVGDVRQVRRLVLLH